MNGPRPRRAAITGVLALALLVPAGAVQAAGPETLVLHQDPFDVTLYDLDGDGAGPGDLFTWIAPVGADDGRSGSVVGTHVTVAMPTSGPFAEVRIGTSVIDLGNGDRIALGGLVPVTTPLGQIAPGTELINAVIGGTGVYGGAKGEIRSLRAEDGSWTHTLTYRTADLTAPVRSFSDVSSYVSATADLTGDGEIGPGDLRVYHVISMTDEGVPLEARGASFIVNASTGDGGSAQALGYDVLRVGDDLLADLAAPPVLGPSGQLAGPAVNPIVGGTGDLAGALGTWAYGSLDDGLATRTIELLAAQPEAVTRSLVLNTAAAPVRMTDRGAAGESLGDLQGWELPFTGDDGESGVAYGYATTVAPATDGTPVRTVMGLISLQFADGSTLLVGDLHTQVAAIPDAADAAVTRPVLGGTGRFAGHSGELITTRDGAGGLVHTFTLRGPAA